MRVLRFSTLAFLGLSCSGFAQDAVDADQANPAVLQQKVREWVRVRQLIAEEAAEWEGQKAQLAPLNELRAKEVAQLDEYITAAGSRLQDADEERQGLLTDEATLRDQREMAENKITKLETQLRPQIKRFPIPLRDAVSEAIGRLEKPDASAPLQNRWRDVLAVLGEASRFQNKITTDTELRDFDGSRVEVDVIYLGLNQAWYVDRAGKNAGTGTPNTDGWVWTADNSLAGPVRKMLEISNKKSNPDFIKLPISASSK